MATRSRRVKFANAYITKDEEGDLYIIEVTKDGNKETNLTEELEGWIDIEGISLTIQKDVKDKMEN